MNASDDGYIREVVRERKRPVAKGTGLSESCGVVSQIQFESESTTFPVNGSRISLPARAWSSKSNKPFNVPAIASVEPFPIRPRFQLSSMKRVTEDWSVTR